MAAEEEMPLDQLLRAHPVSAHWRRILMERLDTLAAVYRLAAALTGVAYPIELAGTGRRPWTLP